MHTPGPWEVRRANRPTDGQFDWAIGALVNDRQSCIAEAFGRVAVDSYPDAEANARLIAAAPDLLEALKIARKCIAYCRKAHKDAQSGEGIPVEIFLDAAIAKATGVQS